MKTHDPSFKNTYGPWAIVTGASSGIGREFARQLAAAGLNLILVARRQPELESLADELKTECLVLPADLALRTEVERVISTIAGMDVGLLIAAAGFGTSGDFVDARIEEELAMLAVNCRAPMMLARHCAPRMAARGRGGIVLLGSIVGFQGVPRAAHYAATKAYVQSLAEGLHHELSPHGVHVMASAPGPVASEFGTRAGMKIGKAMSPATVARETLHSMGRRTTVVPGGLSKFLTYSLALLPRWGRVRVMQLVMQGMTPRA